MAYHRHHGIDVRIVRIFNTYGPRMRPRRRPGGVELHRAGPAGRAAHHLRRRLPDPVVLLRRRRGAGLPDLLDSDTVGPVNIGNPHEFTVTELAKVVLSVTGSSSEIVYHPLPGRRPDAAQARHRPGHAGARLGARGRAHRGCHAHHRVVPPARPQLTGVSGRGPRRPRGWPGTTRRCDGGRRRRWCGPRSRTPRSARVASTRRRGCPSGLVSSQRTSPVNPVAATTSSTSSRMGISWFEPRFTGSAPS